MNIKLVILQILNESRRYALPLEIIRTQAQIRVGAAVGDGELNTAVTALEDKGFIDTRKDELTKDLKYTITNEGITYLGR